MKKNWPSPESRLATESPAWTLARTVPVYAQVTGGNPVLHGTGILLKIADSGFLVSAAHVFADAFKGDQALFVGGGPTLVSLGGLNPRISRDRDHVDVAFLRLPEELTATISEFKTFLRLDQVDLEHRPPEQGWYSILGFPRELSRINADQRQLESDALCQHTFLYEGELDQAEIGTSIALSFAEHGLRDDIGQPLRPIALQGVSGCGIWRISTEDGLQRQDTWDPSLIRLAGIEHSVLGRKAIKGLLAFQLISGIRRQHPDLASAISLVRGRSESRGLPIFRSRQV